jgi:molecular chaperone GrpE
MRGSDRTGGEPNDSQTTPETGASGSSAPATGAEARGGERAAGKGSDTAELDARTELISDEIEAELRELDELRDRHLRIVAEFENYRKRTRRELSEARQLGQGDMALALLEVLDDLSRVLTTPAAQTTIDSLHEGVELIDRKLRKKLEDAGLQQVDTGEGVRFDPSVHEALLTVEVSDPELDDQISRVFQPGYLFGERLLRPAQVEVQQHRAAPGGVAAPGAARRPGADGEA